MPDPDFTKRHPIAEKLERLDMMRRREVIEIPEFYVGKRLIFFLSTFRQASYANKLEI